MGFKKVLIILYFVRKNNVRYFDVCYYNSLTRGSHDKRIIKKRGKEENKTRKKNQMSQISHLPDYR